MLYFLRVYTKCKNADTLSNVMEVTCRKQITWHDLQHIIKDGDVIGLPALAVTNLPAEVLRVVLAQHDTYHTPNDSTIILANDIHSLGAAPDLDDFIERRMINVS